MRAARNLEALCQLTEMHYRQALIPVRLITRREAELRAALRELDQRHSDMHAQSAQDRAMQTLGADLLWQQWAERMRRDLNTELACTLARKEALMSSVRRAFGRLQAVRGLADKHAQNTRRDLASRTLSRAIDIDLQSR